MSNLPVKKRKRRRIDRMTLPDGRTQEGKALRVFRQKITHAFDGELGDLGDIELSLMQKPFLYLVTHPMLREDGSLDDTWRWCYLSVERGLRALCELVSKKPPPKLMTIQEIFKDIEEHGVQT